MKAYEALVIFPSQNMGEALQSGGRNAFEELVKKEGGKVLSRTELGKRLLGYTIKKAREGYFVSFVFELSPEKMDGLKKLLQLAEDILKFTITVKPKVTLTRPSKPATSHAAQAGERR
ncbi:MAG: 30S ribosomal protein S6 [Candidatus Omnitrophica bacterium]|nr:30S ribosomal protein S6 [Candidatus Omnitrophota bacterium]